MLQVEFGGGWLVRATGDNCGNGQQGETTNRVVRHAWSVQQIGVEVGAIDLQQGRRDGALQGAEDLRTPLGRTFFQAQRTLYKAKGRGHARSRQTFGAPLADRVAYPANIGAADTASFCYQACVVGDQRLEALGNIAHRTFSD